MFLHVSEFTLKFCHCDKLMNFGSVRILQEVILGSTGATYPAWLDDLMVAIETVLNLHQLLKVILENNMRVE